MVSLQSELTSFYTPVRFNNDDDPSVHIVPFVKDDRYLVESNSLPTKSSSMTSLNTSCNVVFSSAGNPIVSIARPKSSLSSTPSTQPDQVSSLLHLSFNNNNPFNEDVISSTTAINSKSDNCVGSQMGRQHVPISATSNSSPDYTVPNFSFLPAVSAPGFSSTDLMSFTPLTLTQESHITGSQIVSTHQSVSLQVSVNNHVITPVSVGTPMRSNKRLTLDSSMEESIPKAQNLTGKMPDGLHTRRPAQQLHFNDNARSSDSLILDSLNDINSNIRNLGDETRAISKKLDSLVERVGNLELENVAMSERLDLVETRVEQGLNSDSSQRVWVPQEVPTRVLMLGDSNVTGKIRFGTEKGTLGAHLPGEDRFIATAEFLPDLSDSNSANFAQKFTDIVIGLGTNDLRGGQSGNDCCPRDLAANVYRYALDALRINPSLQIFFPAVVPTSNAVTNSKIDRYNSLLLDMTRSHPNFTYVNVAGGLKSRNNTLSEKYLEVRNDVSGLHLNRQGLSIYASRLKAALRARHELPVFVNNFRRGGGGRGRVGRQRGNSRGDNATATSQASNPGSSIGGDVEDGQRGALRRGRGGLRRRPWPRGRMGQRGSVAPA